MELYGTIRDFRVPYGTVWNCMGPWTVGDHKEKGLYRTIQNCIGKLYDGLKRKRYPGLADWKKPD